MNKDVKIERELLKRLPLFPHTRNGKKLSPEKLEELMVLLREQIKKEMNNKD